MDGWREQPLIYQELGGSFQGNTPIRAQAAHSVTQAPNCATRAWIHHEIGSRSYFPRTKSTGLNGRVLIPGAERLHEGEDGEVARFDDDAFLDLADGRHCHLGPGGELFLAELCLLAPVAEPCRQACGLLGVGAVRAPSAPRPGHPAIVDDKYLPVKIYWH